MILRFTEYAHDTYNRSETAWRLSEQLGWEEDIAEVFAHDHKPMAEVEATIEYDTEANTVKVIDAVIDGVRFVPEDTVKVIQVDKGWDCPACTGGHGDFCTAHDWHRQ